MQQVEQLLQAELTARNDAIARARTEGRQLRERVESLEHDLAVERERSESSAKDLYKERLHAEALVAENKTLRRNSEALASELDALASSVNRHMAHPSKDAAWADKGMAHAAAAASPAPSQSRQSPAQTTCPMPPPLLSGPSTSHAIKEEGRQAGADVQADAAHAREGRRTATEWREGSWGGGGAAEASWGSPVVPSVASPL